MDGCRKAVEAGQAYATANQLLLSSLAKLCSHQEKHGLATVRSLQPRRAELAWLIELVRLNARVC